MTGEKQNNVLVLLPEDDAVPTHGGGAGIHPLCSLQSVADAMVLPPQGRYGNDVFSAHSRLQAQLDAGDTSTWRGLLAVALLADTWQEDCAVKVRCVDGTCSAFAQAALAACGSAVLHLVTLEKGKLSGVVGMADRRFGLIPPATGERLGALLPNRVNWYDRKQGVWYDPCAFLCQRDRLTLAARLEAMEGAEVVQRFARDVRAQEEQVHRRALSEEGTADWRACVRAVAGLLPEEDFAPLTAQTMPYRANLEGNPLLRCLGGKSAEHIRQQPQVQYCWHGHVFARSNEQLGVEPVRGTALDDVDAACAMLEQHSRRYARDLAMRLDAFLEEKGTGLLPGAMEEIRRWQTEALDASMAVVQPLELAWPWDDASPALRLLLKEALGDDLAKAVLTPFTEQLTLMAGASLGDAAMGLLCRVLQEEGVWTALPPLSESLADAVARHGWADGGRLTDCLRIAPAGEAVEVTLLLHGAAQVRMTRRYAPEQLVRWAVEEVPEVALWPSVPLPSERWHAYWLSVRGKMEVRCLCGDVWTSCQAEADDCCVLRTDTMPSCVLLYQDGQCRGAVCYQAPTYHPAMLGEAAAALDYGSSGTAMAIHVGGQTQLIQIPALRHVMLCGERESKLLDRLPAGAMGPIAPSAVSLLRETGQPTLFADGHLCMEELPEQPQRGLLWRDDGQGVCARLLLFQETMLLASFHAVMCGAERISWHVVLPAAMKSEDRLRLHRELEQTAEQTARVTGLLSASGGTVSLQRESISAGLYLRDSGVMRGGFAMLTVGAASASMALWLRGMNRPAVEYHGTGGVLTMLTGELKARPLLLAQELAGVAGCTEDQLVVEATDGMDAWSHRQQLLEYLLGTHLQETMARLELCLQQGSMTRVQALLLLEFAAQMTLMGHALEQVRRNPLLNDYLPRELQVCLCGRGSLVLAGMNPMLSGAMTSFVRLAMSLDHPVRALRMTVSGCPKLEAVLGVSAMYPAAPQEAAENAMADAMPLLHLMARFFMQFHASYPQACDLLFPNMFDAYGNYTPLGEELVTAAVARQGVIDRMENRFLQCLEEVRASWPVVEPVTQEGEAKE